MPLGCTGFMFSCFLFCIHPKHLRILRTTAARNIQEKAISLPQVTTSQFSQSLAEIRNSLEGRWWELHLSNKEMGTIRSKQLDEVVTFTPAGHQYLSTQLFTLFTGIGYTIRVRMHLPLPLGGPETLFLPSGNRSLIQNDLCIHDCQA